MRRTGRSASSEPRRGNGLTPASTGLVVLALLVAYGLGGDDLPTDGPVTFADTESIQRSGVFASAGQSVVFGATTVENRGDDPASLQAGSLIGDVDAEQAVVVDVRVIDLGPAPGASDLLAASIWPAKGWRRWWRSATPVEDAPLPAGHAAEVVYVIDVRETGDWQWDQSAVDYEVDGTRYRTLTNFGFQVCPPEPAACQPLNER